MNPNKPMSELPIIESLNTSSPNSLEWTLLHKLDEVIDIVNKQSQYINQVSAGAQAILTNLEERKP